MTQLKTSVSRSVALLLCVAVALLGCSNYRVVLRPVSEEAVLNERQAVLAPPTPALEERLIEGVTSIRAPEGWVRLRFDVNERGQTDRIAVVQSSSPEFESAAVDLLASWSFLPGTREGLPAEFNDMEATLYFAEAPTFFDSQEGTFTTVGIILLTFAVIIVIGITTGVGLTSGG